MFNLKNLALPSKRLNQFAEAYIYQIKNSEKVTQKISWYKQAVDTFMEEGFHYLPDEQRLSKLFGYLASIKASAVDHRTGLLLIRKNHAIKLIFTNENKKVLGYIGFGKKLVSEADHYLKENIIYSLIYPAIEKRVVEDGHIHAPAVSPLEEYTLSYPGFRLLAVLFPKTLKVSKK